MPSTQTLFFTGHEGVRLATHDLEPPAPGHVTVRTRLSGISAGTELLYYRGDIPDSLVADSAIDTLSGPLRYPMPYGYCVVGVVEAAGDAEGESWVGRRVFAFHPHSDRFNTPLHRLVLLPDTLSDEDAIFLPSMETAVGLIHDAAPLLGERAVVLGLGVVGLLVGTLLCGGGLTLTIGIDRYPLRRRQAESLGFHYAVALEDECTLREALGLDLPAGGADLSLEVSGDPAALDRAIALTGYSGRILVGSWYGSRPATLRLGERFHRAKQTIVSSQVSALHPRLQGRWTRERRLNVAIDALHRIRPARLITHRYPLDAAREAYALLAHDPGSAIQVVFSYTP